MAEKNQDKHTRCLPLKYPNTDARAGRRGQGGFGEPLQESADPEGLVLDYPVPREDAQQMALGA